MIWLPEPASLRVTYNIRRFKSPLTAWPWSRDTLKRRSDRWLTASKEGGLKKLTLHGLNPWAIQVLLILALGLVDSAPYWITLDNFYEIAVTANYLDCTLISQNLS
jgi:hypothetical protein